MFTYKIRSWSRNLKPSQATQFKLFLDSGRRQSQVPVPGGQLHHHSPSSFWRRTGERTLPKAAALNFLAALLDREVDRDQFLKPGQSSSFECRAWMNTSLPKYPLSLLRGSSYKNKILVLTLFELIRKAWALVFNPLLIQLECGFELWPNLYSKS